MVDERQEARQEARRESRRIAMDRFKQRESPQEKQDRVRNAPKSERFKRRQERLERVRSMASLRLRVSPSNDEMRKVLKHPTVGPFRAEGSTEWPLDQFTKRRFRDGSITLAESEQREQEVEPMATEQQVPEQRQHEARATTQPQPEEPKRTRKPAEAS
jgi:hypothetical protein